MSRPIWTEPKQMEDDFKSYIDYCQDKERMPTITGFAIFKNIHPDTFYEYKNNKDGRYSEAVKMIDLYIEEEGTQTLINARNPAGTIFYLKNKLNWADKQEITTNQTNTVNVLSLNKDDLVNKVMGLLEDNSTK